MNFCVILNNSTIGKSQSDLVSVRGVKAMAGGDEESGVDDGRRTAAGDPTFSVVVIANILNEPGTSESPFDFGDGGTVDDSLIYFGEDYGEGDEQ